MLRVLTGLCFLFLLCLPVGAEYASITREVKKFNSGDPVLDAMFRNALKDIERQITIDKDGTVYVQTGDIPAEWLRDSSAQIRPYLFFVKEDPALAKLVKGIIARQAGYLALNPYANAFNRNYTIWEEKYELDSLAYPITLAWTYWKVTGDASIFTGKVRKGFYKALETMLNEQDHASSPRRYTHKELKNNPAAHTGMIWTGFRPSDDACVYNYLIPSEMMAVVALGQLEEISRLAWKDPGTAARADKLRREVDAGIQKYGVVTSSSGAATFAYEVDGLGHQNIMDDGNLPSLLSTPYFGYAGPGDAVYHATRSRLLSTENPFFYSGAAASGVGSPHTPKGYIWPLGLLAQGLSAVDEGERKLVLKELLASDPGDHRLHESFDPNNVKKFTREDFGWPNALFAEYILVTRLGRAPLPVGTRAGSVPVPVPAAVK